MRSEPVPIFTQVVHRANP